VLWLSISIYVTGAVMSALAPSFGLLLAGRFVWGVGAAGGRVVAFAILRDTTDGDRMARTMSFMMAVFIVVPVLAPSIGAVIISVAPWQTTFWMSAVFGIALLAWSARLGETLAPANRRTDLFASVPATARRMATEPTIAAPVLALTAVMTIMSTYLASSELIIADLFGFGDRFPIVFGAVAAVFGAAALLNGRLLDRIGIGGVIGPAAGIYLVAGLVVLGVTLAADGTPNFWIFMPVLALALSCQMFLMPSLNTLALGPMGDAAGTASALVATFSTAVGASLGAVVDAQFEDTVTPLAVALVIAATIVVSLVALTLRRNTTLR
jgi:DHA1 family bicyclomycin/chloramphenicol resistance-like MFS transporter